MEFDDIMVLIYNMDDDDTRIAAKIAINNYYLAGNDDAMILYAYYRRKANRLDCDACGHIRQKKGRIYNLYFNGRIVMTYPDNEVANIIKVGDVVVVEFADGKIAVHTCDIIVKGGYKYEGSY